MRRVRFLPRPNLHRPGLDVLTLLCLGLVGVHLAIELAGGVDEMGSRGLYDRVGLSMPGMLKGWIWQLGTYGVFHGTWFHLLINVMIIYMIGGRVVHILGSRAFLRIFVGGLLAGGVVHLVLYPKYPLGEGLTTAYIPLVGASGGVMALFLALCGLSPDSRMWPLMISGKNLGRGLMLSALILMLMTPGLKVPFLGALGSQLVEGGGAALLFQVSHACHFGGGLVGLFFAARLLRAPVSLEDLRRARERREGAGAEI